MANESRENEQIILTCIFVFSVLAILANALVIILVLTSKRLRTYVNGFLVSLAASDILINICVAFPFVFFSWEKQHIKIATTLYKYFLASASMSELGNLCAATYERYLAVVKPFQYKTRIKKYFCIIIPVVWLSSFLVSLIVFLHYADLKKSVKKMIVIPTLLIFVLLPLFIIIIFYHYIFVSLVKQKKTIHTLGSIHPHVLHQRKKREVKLVKMFAVVASLYIFSTIPGLLHESVGEIRNFTLPGCTTSFALFLSYFGIVLSSLANPFIYTFSKQDFRQQIKVIFKNIPQCKMWDRQT
ncbi:octopamine receptor beta-2R-like [Actinia tenebrosa]|uniref:Octopamine receptor beta-2R-like n=1 Tax=Actinia tenebrosa TaxID=6105 RepID=A0A6P8H909_ACTTE|nr:octopamine receptor beta-2R-like [Actinia tenebrosa]